MAPVAAPKISRHRPSVNAVDAIAIKGSTAARRRPAVTISALQPTRPTSAPAPGMPITAPRPRHSSTEPSVAASAPSRCWANGTSGAHDDKAKPAMNSDNCVARLGARSDAAWPCAAGGLPGA